MEYAARTQPVENCAPKVLAVPTDLDDRIVHILSKTVVPMFNALIATSSESRQPR
jgi:hypothetical protein